MSARDVILAGVLVFVFGTAFFIMNFVFNETVDDMLEVPVINASNATAGSIGGIRNTMGRLDYLVFGLFIGLVLALIISGWFVGGNPIFMFIYFIVVVLGVVFSTIMSNVWETMSQASVFGSTVAEFTITNNLLLNLPIYMSVIGFIGLVVMFAKPYFQGE